MSADILERLNGSWKGKLLESKEALRKLSDLRGLTKIDRFADLELGLVDVPSPNRLPEKILKQLSSFGVIDHTLGGMVSVPLRSKDGRIVNFYFLSLNGASTPGDGEESHGDRIIRAGGIVNRKAFDVFKSLVIVDNLPDYFAYFQNVKENVVPLIRSQHMPEDIAAALAVSKVEELILVNESPYWEILREKIKDLNLRMYEVTLPEGKSVADFLAGSSSNRLLAHIEAEKAKQLKASAGEKSNAPVALAAGDQGERLSIIEEIGELRFAAHDRVYRVRGFNKDGFEKIVQVSLEMDGKTFPDKIDLSRSQGRMRFATIAGNEFETSAELIRDDLAFIYQTLDRMQDERFKAKAGIVEKNVHVLTPDEASKAVDRLVKRDILNEILIRDTSMLGYVEEEVNKKLFYLSASSRLTGKPISVLDISPPGTGKSFGISTIMDLMPPDELLRYTRLTGRTLDYKSEEELKGKALYVEEIVGMEESLESIRMLLSSGELATSSVEKDPRTGVMRSVEHRTKANIPLLSSGVRDIFDEETLSRFMLTYNDVTERHIERVLKSQAQGYAGSRGRSDATREKILRRHWNYQKVMDPSVEVRIPFADKITLSSSLPIVTRKQESYLRLIYTIAFLRQHGRERKKERDESGELTYIFAGREDVVTANEIAAHWLRFARSDLTRRQHDGYQVIESYCIGRIKEKRIALHELTFSRREVREYAGWDEAAARRLFDELERLEYIRRVRGDGQGTRYLYRLVLYGGKGASPEDVRLLDPDTL